MWRLLGNLTNRYHFTASQLSAIEKTTDSENPHRHWAIFQGQATSLMTH